MPNKRSPVAVSEDHESTPIYLRVPNVLLAAIAEYHERQSAAAAVGVRVSRSAAVHQLIRDGLAVNAPKSKRARKVRS